MTKRPSARRQLSRTDTAAARVLAAPMDRTVHDEWSEVTDRLRKLNAQALQLGQNQAELLAFLRKL